MDKTRVQEGLGPVLDPVYRCEKTNEVQLFFRIPTEIRCLVRVKVYPFYRSVHVKLKMVSKRGTIRPWTTTILYTNKKGEKGVEEG